MGAPIKHRVRVGDRFGRRVVTAPEAPAKKFQARRCQVVCDCGYKSSIIISKLVSGKADVCASCAPRPPSKSKHGKSQTYEYRVWSRLCNCARDPGADGFVDAHRLGIDASWEGPGGFEWFLAAVGYRPSSDHVLRRIDSTKGWLGTNTVWEHKPARKPSKTTTITVAGKTRTITEWADETGLAVSTIRHRLFLGWTPDDAVTTAPKAKPRHIPTAGAGTGTWLRAYDTRKHYRTWAKLSGISEQTIRRRVQLGWEPNRAVSEPVSVRHQQFPRGRGPQ